MTISSQFRTLLCAGIAGALSFAAPVLAQDANLPACSASVTDHCVQREGGSHAVRHATASRHHREAKRHHHHRKARHHNRRHHHHRHHAAPAKKS